MPIKWTLPELETYKVSEPIPVPLPYATYALDLVSGDLAFPIRVLRGPEAVVQKIRCRFLMYSGEWFLDQRLGVPYYRDILIKNADPLVISSVFKAVLLSVPGVKSVDSFTAILDKATRVLSVDFNATLYDGSVITAIDEPFILG